MNQKYKTLSSNIILFAISSFGHKILAFLLVPLYTNILSTAEYGTIDLIAATTNLLLPIFTLNISEAVMRFTIENKGNDEYLKLGIRVCLIGTLSLGVILGILYLIPYGSEYRLYYIWIFIIFLLNSVYNLETNYLRAIDKVSVMVLGSLINSSVMLVLDVILIAWLGWGVGGYYVAMSVGLVFSAFFMLIKGKIYNHISFKINSSAKVRKACLAYCIPTIFTTVSWWVNSSLDRYFVTALCGVDQNGIYSVAYKIPTILGVFQSIFNQAWILSAVKDFDENDSDGFFGKTYEFSNSMMVLVTAGIMVFNILLSRLLYAKDFFVAWKYVPFLLIATLFSALSGYIGGAFSAVKDTKSCAYTVVVSAIVNIILNAILIPQLGVQGAAIATAIAYLVAWAMRMKLIKKYIRMKIHLIKDTIIYALLLTQLILSITESHIYAGQLIIIAVILLLYANEYKYTFNSLIEKYWKTKRHNDSNI